MEMDESMELTAAQIDEIKKKVEELKKKDPAKNKQVYPIVVFGDERDEKPVYVAYFREPDFMSFSKFLKLQRTDELKAIRAMALDTFIDGDKELIDNDSLFLFGLSGQLSNTISARQSKVVNF